VVSEPQILDVRRDADSVHLRMRIPSRLHHLAGHFPGVPIVPGVVLLKWAIDLGRKELALGGAFQRLSALKFMRIMPLDTDVTLDLSAEKGVLAFEYQDAGRSCVQGRAHFA